MANGPARASVTSEMIDMDYKDNRKRNRRERGAIEYTRP